jgi:hypothetical protein
VDVQSKRGHFLFMLESALDEPGATALFVLLVAHKSGIIISFLDAATAVAIARLLLLGSHRRNSQSLPVATIFFAFAVCALEIEKPPWVILAFGMKSLFGHGNACSFGRNGAALFVEVNFL